MILSDFEKSEQKDKIEILKQTQAEIQKVFDYKVIPHRNHIFYEYNIKEKTIEVAEFDELPPIKFEDAMNGIISKDKKVTRKENCIYVSAMNLKNAKKILKRDLNILTS